MQAIPMKHTKRTSLLAGVLATVAVLSVGCSKSADRPDQKWTPPVVASGSIAGLVGAVRLYKYQDTVMGIQSLGKGSAKLLFLSRAGNSWSEMPVTAPAEYLWGGAAIDPQGKRILLPEGYAENEQLVMKAFIGVITDNHGLEDMTEKEWMTDKRTLLGETGPNVKLNRPGKRYGVGLGPGILIGSEAILPFSLHSETFFGINNVSNGPYASGVFHSTDSGKSWQMEKVSDLDGGAPAICKTMGRYYYFATHPLCLWASRKSIENDKWDESKAITKSLALVLGLYGVAGGNDTVHVCWEDRRHNKWRFNPEGPPIENNDIFYRYRKDSDKDWSKEVLLSEGLLYSYAPSISAEGDKVVVVWAGIRTADKQHTDMRPNDIYYVTSKNGGKTWTEPMKVTDGVKDGMTAGMPQLALLNGTIHLLYIQGKSEKSQELSPGLTKFDKQPWPIYYTQRPFPN